MYKLNVKTIVDKYLMQYWLMPMQLQTELQNVYHQLDSQQVLVKCQIVLIHRLVDFEMNLIIYAQI